MAVTVATMMERGMEQREKFGICNTLITALFEVIQVSRYLRFEIRQNYNLA